MTDNCASLYQQLIAHEELINFKLEFSPEQPGFEDAGFFSNVDNATKSAELIVFQKMFFKLFLEAHKFFESCVLGDETVADYEWNVYLMTIGYLVTTAEHKMIINLHEDSVLKIISEKQNPAQFLNRELLIIGRLLTCTRNSINKSSSLWIWYRKLSILIENSKSLDRQDLLNNIITTVENSANLHICNYYCWTSLRWFFDNSFGSKEKYAIYQMTVDFCFAHPNDCSSWSALSYIICQIGSKLDYNVQNYMSIYQNYVNNNIIERDSKHSLDNTTDFTIDIPVFINKITRYIDSLSIKDWPVFLCLSRVASGVVDGSTPAYLKLWSQQVIEFEEEHGVIEFRNRNPIVPSGIESNLMLSNSIMHCGWKKRLIESMP